jgi:hypothetical protein
MNALDHTILMHVIISQLEALIQPGASFLCLQHWLLEIILPNWGINAFNLVNATSQTLN